jgi:hypothetical protein
LDFSSVIIHDFYCIGIIIPPKEADAELIINPDTALSLPIPFEILQSIPRWTAQVFQFLCRSQYPEFAQGRPIEIGGYSPGRLPVIEPLGLFTREGLDHVIIL